MTEPANDPFSPFYSPRHSGMLTKQGYKRSGKWSYRVRYFLLDRAGESLFYFQRRTDPTPIGRIPLAGTPRPQVWSDPKGKMKYRFCVGPIGSEKRVYVLLAKSDEEMEEWIEVLRECLPQPAAAEKGQEASAAVPEISNGDLQPDSDLEDEGMTEEEVEALLAQEIEMEVQRTREEQAMRKAKRGLLARAVGGRADRASSSVFDESVRTGGLSEMDEYLSRLSCDVGKLIAEGLEEEEPAREEYVASALSRVAREPMDEEEKEKEEQPAGQLDS